MRRLDYDIYRRDRGPELFRRRIEIENRRSGRSPRSRPRDGVEERILSRLIRSRYERLLSTGELERIGPRKWRWHCPDVGGRGDAETRRQGDKGTRGQGDKGTRGQGDKAIGGLDDGV